MAIQINVNAGLDAKTSSVQASGNVIHVITDVERETFNIKDANLKKLVEKYFGKSPNDAYLHSETPWGDLYKTYNWPQVQVNLVVQSATILGITSEPQIINTQKFSNNSSVKGNFNVAITQQVNNTSQSNWSSSNKISVGQKVSYNIGFLGVGVKGETSMSYERTWGEGGSVSKSVTIGTSSGVSVALDPGESILAELSASRGVMKVRLVYNAYLTGVSAVNYNPTFKGHHFFALDIGGLLAAGGISNSVQVTEDIEIGFFGNSEIIIKDGKGKATLLYNSAVQAK
ncbi:follicular epithelium yolk protein subunit [Flavobacterium foetidum]|uniref:follicular epithelium yolk protein subunit n=1 Tax=Flavobacterium foetidum TaxID=2026681 RepID=UPI00107539FD|nr:follicular epithelium yolk protein subunit [Flavobacterium foetidum]KAF2515957.1 follicular epithelium yolk protein subunit [Flavobacterium foetidum]